MPVYTLPKPQSLDQPALNRSPWAARVRGFGQGALESLQGLMGGDDVGSQLMAPATPMMAGEGELGPLAKKAVGGLKDIAESAYGAVKGLSGKFYSRLTDAATRLPDVAHPNKITSYLASQAAPEEMQYRGLSDFLKAQGNRMVPREEVLQHLEQNPITMSEKTLARPYEHGSMRDPDATRYSDYQLPGGTNYRERLTMLPPKGVEDIPSEIRTAFYDNGAVNASEMYGMTPEQMERLQATIDLRTGNRPPTYQSPHWDEPNVLVHSRTQERNLPGPEQPTGAYTVGYTGVHGRPMSTTWDSMAGAEGAAAGVRQLGYEPSLTPIMKPTPGPKGRMLENIQSDWHQAGARAGYMNPNAPRPTAMDLDVAYVKFGDTLKALGVDHPDTNTAFHQWDEIRRAYEDGPKGVPDAPFKKSWPDLALKQELYDAATSPDISWVGVTPGSESVKRGESLKPTFHDETLVNKLRDLLKPFGGEIGQGSADVGGTPAYISGLGPRDIFPVGTYANPGAQEPVAMALGHTPTEIEANLGATLQKMNQQARTRGFSMATLTPEMQDAIAKRGFPIMALLGLMKQRSNQSEP